MRTLEQIYGNCRVCDDDDGKDHMIWAGARDKDGLCVVRAPDYSRDETGVKTWMQSVRRAIQNISTKAPIQPGMMLFQTCTVDGCISCTKMTTKKRGGKFVSARMRGNPIFALANKRMWDKRGRKVSDEAVRQIMLSEKSNEELAAEHGIRPATVWSYRSGRARKAAAHGALGVFAGLML